MTVKGKLQYGLQSENVNLQELLTPDETSEDLCYDVEGNLE